MSFISEKVAYLDGLADGLVEVFVADPDNLGTMGQRLAQVVDERFSIANWQQRNATSNESCGSGRKASLHRLQRVNLQRWRWIVGSGGLRCSGPPKSMQPTLPTLRCGRALRPKHNVGCCLRLGMVERGRSLCSRSWC